MGIRVPEADSVDEEKSSWPIIIAISAGIVGGLIAAALVYSARQNAPEEKMYDARTIIDQCHRKIKEIESGLESLKQPFMAGAN
jgi:hypothetical protein